MDISSKVISFDFYFKGLFGNKLRTWPTLEDFKKSGYVGSVTIRYRGDKGGMYCAYNVTNPLEVISKFVGEGANIDLFIFNESAPDEKLTIQGELTYDYRGYNLFYSTEKGKMRDCLKNGKTITGLAAKLLLQSHLFPSSLEDLMELMELYPEHVIEFSTYEMALGDCSNRNTLIWEVRKY